MNDLPKPPPTWEEVSSDPRYESLEPSKKRDLYKNWASTAAKFIRQDQSVSPQRKEQARRMIAQGYSQIEKDPLITGETAKEVGRTAATSLAALPLTLVGVADYVMLGAEKAVSDDDKDTFFGRGVAMSQAATAKYVQGAKTIFNDQQRKRALSEIDIAANLVVNDRLSAEGLSNVQDRISELVAEANMEGVSYTNPMRRLDSPLNSGLLAAYKVTLDPVYLETLKRNVTLPFVNQQADENIAEAAKNLPPFLADVLQNATDPSEMVFAAAEVGTGPIPLNVIRGSGKLAKVTNRVSKSVPGRIVAGGLEEVPQELLQQMLENPYSTEEDYKHAALIAFLTGGSVAGAGAGGGAVFRKLSTKEEIDAEVAQQEQAQAQEPIEQPSQFEEVAAEPQQVQEAQEMQGDEGTEVPAEPIIPEPEQQQAPTETRGDSQYQTERISREFESSDEGKRLVNDFMLRLEASNPEAFSDLDVEIVDSGTMLSMFDKDSEARDGAYDKKTNTLYLNRDSQYNKGDQVINALLHEGGHFAEKFGVGEEVVSSEWGTLSDDQRVQAYEEYEGRKLTDEERTNFLVDETAQSQARSEWFAFQFKRLVQDGYDSLIKDGRSKAFADKLMDFWNNMRSMFREWVGSEELSTKELDNKILETMGFTQGLKQPTQFEPQMRAFKEAAKPDRSSLGIVPNRPAQVQAMQREGQAQQPIPPRPTQPKPTVPRMQREPQQTENPQVPDVPEPEAVQPEPAAPAKKATKKAAVKKVATKRPTQRAPQPQQQAKRTFIGDNRRGYPVYEDENGVRFYLENGIRMEQTLEVTPRGLTKQTPQQLYEDGRRDFLSADEVESFSKPKQEDTTDVQEKEMQVAQEREEVAQVEDSVKQAMKDAFDGLLGAPRRVIEQKPIPAEKVPAFMELARNIVSQPITWTPRKLALFMDEVLNGRAREYVEAMWMALGMVDNSLRTTQDWNVVYSEIDDQPDAAQSDTETDIDDQGVEVDEDSQVDQSRYVSEFVRMALVNNESVDRNMLNRIAKNRAPLLNKKQVDEAAELGIVYAAKDIIKGKSEQDAFDALVDLYQRQPNLTSKTSTSRVNQAYSTPAPLAYLAGRLSSFPEEMRGTVLEPTAGNGMLLLEVPTNHAEVNEIDQVRRKNLETQGYGSLIAGDNTVSSADASSPMYATALAQQAMGADYIIANPPFGALKDENSKSRRFLVKLPDGRELETKAIDHAIVLNTLNAIPDNGRAVFIIGSGGGNADSADVRQQKYGSGQAAEFFALLYDNYNVTDHFSINGDLYKKQGAGWNLDMLVVDGRGKSQLEYPWENVPEIQNTWNDVREKLESKLPARPNSDYTGSIQPSNAGIRSGRPSGARPEQTGPITEQEPGGSGVQGADSDIPGDTRGDRRPDAISPEQRPGSQVRDSGDAISEPQSVDRVNPSDVKVKAVGKYQAEYESVSQSGSGDLITPINIASSQRASILTIEKEVGNIDEYVTKELGYKSMTEMQEALMAHQVDAVALAIYNAKNGQGMVVGDQTGVGKGRIAAALIRWAKRNKIIPVFVTAKPGLYKDMLRDLDGVKSYDDTAPMFTNFQFSEGKGGNILTDERGNQWKVTKRSVEKQLDYIKRNGSLPAGVDVMFTTYDQIGKDRPKGFSESKKDAARRKRYGSPAPDGKRMEAIRKIAPKSMFILDESHKAAGMGSEINLRMLQLMQASRTTYYSSATFSKNPTSMPFYSKTAMSEVGIEPDRMVEIMQDGGVPLMQFISNMLARAGQYLRRERSYDGIEMKFEQALESAENDAEIADVYTDTLNQVYWFWKRVNHHIEAENKRLKKAAKSANMSQADAGVESSRFDGAKLFNFTQMYLMSLKADASANRAIEEFQAGRKPVIALQNTNEGAIEELFARDEAGDVSMNGMLLRSLDSILTYREKIPGQEPEVKQIDLDEIGLRQEYNDLVEFIRNQDLSGMPISPIDHIRDRLEEAGIKVAEITGRKRRLSADGNLYDRDPREIGAIGANRSMDRFNNKTNSDEDGLGAIIINAAGSTGFSLHSSKDYKDQSPRTMVVAQPQADINEFTQTLGRIHRTGQVHPPKFVILTTALPAEKRLSGMLQRKMALLNANTTSNADSDVSSASNAVDIFNQYGDDVVRQVLIENTGIVAAMPSMFDSGSGTAEFLSNEVISKYQASETPGSFASKVTGHLVLAPVEDQKTFWEAVESEYRSLIDYLNEIGENKLIATPEDYQAEVLEETDLYSSDGTSPFSESAKLQRIKAVSKKKPLPPEELFPMAETSAESVDLASREAVQLIYAQMNEATKAARDKASERNQEITPDRIAAIKAKYESAIAAINSAKKLVGQQVKIGADVEAGEVSTVSALGVVTDVKYDLENPQKRSAHKVVVHVNNSKQKLSIPLSQLSQITEHDIPRQSFSEAYNNTMDLGGEKFIAVGNLFGAYAQLSEQGFSGRMITFTRKDGSVDQGIELPARYSRFQSTSVTSGEQLRELAQQADAKISSSIGLSIRPVFPNNDSTESYSYLQVIVPAAKARGGKVWMNPSIQKMMEGNEFEQRNSLMYGRLRAGKEGELVSKLSSLGVTLSYNSKNGDTLGTPPRRSAHKFGVRAVIDPRIADEVKAGLDVYYDVQSNQSALDHANVIIEQRGLDGAVRLMKDKRYDMPIQVRTTLAMLTTLQHNKLGSIAKDEGDNAGATMHFGKARDILNWKHSWDREVGHGTEINRMWRKLTPDGYLADYKEGIDSAMMKALRPFMDESEALAKELLRIAGAVGSDLSNKRAFINAVIELTKERAFRKSAKDNLDQVFGGSKTIWGRYSDQAAKSLVSAIGGNFKNAKERAALEEFTSRLTSALRAQVSKNLPPRRQREKPSDMDVLIEGITNADKYREVWEKAQEMAMEKYAGNPEALKAIANAFGTMTTYSGKAVSGVLKSELDAIGKTMAEIAKQHYSQRSADGRELVDRILDKIDVPPHVATKVANIISQEYQKRLAEEQKKALSKIAARGGDRGKVARAAKGNVAKIAEIANMGGLTNEDVYRAIADKLNLPAYSYEVAEQIQRMALRIQDAPAGFQQDERIMEMQAYIAKNIGISGTDLAVSYGYANILMGWTTQIKNTFGSFSNLFAESAVQGIVQPRDFGLYLAGLHKGFMRGIPLAVDTWKEGIVSGGRYKDDLNTPFKHYKLENVGALELVNFGTRGGVPVRSKAIQKLLESKPATFLNAWKYVFRFMQATDMMFYKTAQEGRAYLMAAEIARKSPGKSKKQIAKEVYDILHNSPELVAKAEAQAKEEGLTGRKYKMRVDEIVEQSRPQELYKDSRDYGLRATYNQQPVGVFGLFAYYTRSAGHKFPPFRLVIPFTNVVANVSNVTLDYSPWGFKRAFLGNWGGQGFSTEGPGIVRGMKWISNWRSAPREFKEQLVRSAIGTLGLTAIAMLSAAHEDDEEPAFRVHGAGPKDWRKRRQLMNTGWKPYTIQIGSRFFNYQETPIVLGLSIMGNFFDAERYGTLKAKDSRERMSYAMQQVSSTMLDRSFLSGIADFMDAVTGYDPDGVEKWVARQSQSFAIPNLIKQIDKAFDPTIYTTDDIHKQFIRNVPVARTTLEPMINVLGETVEYQQNPFWSETKDDPVWDFIAKKQAWVSIPSKTTHINGQPMDSEQYSAYMKLSGREIKRRISMELPRLNALPKERAQDRVDDITKEERAKAKDLVRRGYR